MCRIVKPVWDKKQNDIPDKLPFDKSRIYIAKMKKENWIQNIMLSGGLIKQ